MVWQCAARAEFAFAIIEFQLVIGVAVAHPNAIDGFCGLRCERATNGQHGGEAEKAREAFRNMPRTDRQALVTFVESL